MEGGIYAIKNTCNGKLYIGSAVHFEKRWYSHRVALKKGSHYNKHLQSAWSRYGESSFEFVILEIIEETQIKEKLYAREQHYIDLNREAFPSGLYNIAPRAGCTLGFKFSEESKQKLSNSKKGTKYQPTSEEARRNLSKAFKGKPKSKEHAAKISAALKGRRPSQNTIEASVTYWKGRKFSEERKLQMSENRKGKPRNDLEAHLARIAKRKKFDDETEKSIFVDRKAGMLLKEIAAKYGCSTFPVGKAIARQSALAEFYDAP